MIKKSFLVVLMIMTLRITLLAQEQAEDPRVKDLASYKQIDNLSGSLNSIGSDTLNNMMAYWAEAFMKMYPNVKITVEGKGSATAPPALAEGVAQLGPMSRKMKSDEIEAVEKKYGFKPLKVPVALDALAVFVNKDNPVKTLSLPEVDAIFSKGRIREYPSDIAQWTQFNLGQDFAGKAINIYGRNSASGTYGYFKEVAMKKGDYKDSVKEQAGSAAVVRAITEDKFAIGYSGIGYLTSGVRAVPLSAKLGGDSYEANYENVITLKYPLSRELYVYFIKDPDKPMRQLEKEFLKFALSKEGQLLAIKDGYLPLTKDIVLKALNNLEGK